MDIDKETYRQREGCIVTDREGNIQLQTEREHERNNYSEKEGEKGRK